MSVGSEPATSGSVMAKQDRVTPSHRGRRYFSFWASVAQWRSVCMLPSSGAWQLRTKGPIRVRAASALTAAIAVGPRPMPPHSAGIWGSHTPRSLAALRRSMIAVNQAPRSSSEAAAFSSAGRTSSSMNWRTFRRTCSISGLKVKSMAMTRSLPERPPHLGTSSHGGQHRRAPGRSGGADDGAVGAEERDLVVGVPLGPEAAVQQRVVPVAPEDATAHVGGPALRPPVQVVDVAVRAMTTGETAATAVTHGDGPALGRVPPLGL